MQKGSEGLSAGQCGVCVGCIRYRGVWRSMEGYAEGCRGVQKVQRGRVWKVAEGAEGWGVV